MQAIPARDMERTVDPSDAKTREMLPRPKPEPEPLGFGWRSQVMEVMDIRTVVYASDTGAVVQVCDDGISVEADRSPEVVRSLAYLFGWMERHP